ncbi:MAG: galactokinase [Actinomycetota bacterium]
MWHAPGRVNLMGEHIDYLGGVVVPFACDLEIVMATMPFDGEVLLSSLEEPGDVGIPLDRSRGDVAGWGRYAAGVIEAIGEQGLEPRGFRGVLSSSIPTGAGLSSSAALEAVVGLALLGGDRPPPGVLQRAEHLAVGVPCGIMDQIAVLHGVAGHALVVDCAGETWRAVRLPPIGFVVVDTGTRRRLDDGRYATRRAEVEAALTASGAPSFGEASPPRGADPRSRRLRHAVGERDRVAAFIAAVDRGDVRRMGELMNASHASLRDDFEVSSPELDRTAEAAVRSPGCLGARMIGGGFAGCVLALVEPSAVRSFTAAITEKLPGVRAIRVGAVVGAGEI